MSPRHWVLDFEVPGRAAGRKRVRLQVCVCNVNARQRDVLEHAVAIAPNRVEDDVADRRQTCHIGIVLEAFAIKRDAVLPETLYNVPFLESEAVPFHSSGPAGISELRWAPTSKAGSMHVVNPGKAPGQIGKTLLCVTVG